MERRERDKAFFFRTLIEKHLGIGDNQLLEISKKGKTGHMWPVLVEMTHEPIVAKLIFTRMDMRINNHLKKIR